MCVKGGGGGGTMANLLVFADIQAAVHLQRLAIVFCFCICIFLCEVLFHMWLLLYYLYFDRYKLMN